jgi:hypothetical protein
MIDDPGATVRLASVACEIPMGEIYRKVSWE